MASVLVIDPQEDFTIPLADALRQKGHAITTVSDGKEGVELASKERPDAIVLAVEQRGMSGLSICSRLRRDESTRGIPLVLVSVDASSFATHRTSKSKADAYLAKPFSAIELLGVLGNLLENRPARDSIADLDAPVRGRLPRSLQESQVTQAASLPMPTNGRASMETTADLLVSDLPMPREDSGAELDWMVKLRQSIARRDAQIAELRAKVEEAARMQAAMHEKERRHQEELQKIARERDETVKAHMSMQEKLTSTRLDLDDTKKRFAKEKKALEERIAQITKQSEDRAASLQKQMDEKLAAQKKQSDEAIATLKHQLEDMTQREAQKTAGLDSANRQIKSLTQKLDETTRNLETTKRNASDLKAQVDKQANRIAMLEEDLARARMDGEQKAQTIARLEDQLSKMQSDHAKEVAQLTDDLKAAQAASEAKSKTIMMRDDELAKQKANYEKRLASQDDALRRVTNALDSKVLQHTKDLEARDASISGLKQKLAALQNDMAREKAEHEKLLEVASEVHAKEMNRLRDENQQRIMQLETQHQNALKSLQSERDLIENERQALETQAVDLGKRLANVEKQLSITRQQLTEQEKRNSELVEKLNAAEGRASELERMVNEGKKRRQQIADALAEITRLAEAVRLED